MKDLSYLRLFDTYGGLLTEHQRELCELYYMYDLSLTEIAEQKGISKQSVSDTLAKSRALLDEYEEKLHIVQPSVRTEKLCRCWTNFPPRIRNFQKRYKKSRRSCATAKRHKDA